MKRKIIALVMAICVAVGAAGCGDAAENGGSIRNDRNAEDDGRIENGGSAGNGESTENGGSKGSGISIITIDGEKYDLSGDFQKVVSKLVKNGLHPIEEARYYEYDEDGRYLKVWKPSDFTDSTVLVFARESSIITFNPEICPIIVDEYLFFEKYNCTFKTADGITQDSDEDDLKELEGYVPYRGIRDIDSEACIALYVDGKIVDLEEYRDEYEAWLKDAEEEGPKSASGKRLDAKYYPWGSRMQEICLFDSIESCRERVFDLEEEILLAFAVQEACEKLEAKKIKSFDIVHYGYEPEGMAVQFYHYYYDENWDSSKFRREE